MSLNRICLMGRIGRDLELKKTNSGVSVVSFPLAVDRNERLLSAKYTLSACTS